MKLIGRVFGSALVFLGGAFAWLVIGLLWWVCTWVAVAGRRAGEVD